MHKNVILILILTIFALSAKAGSIGFLYQGKTYYQYKDGKKLDESPFNKKNGRSPASVEAVESDKDSLILYFVEDEYARCYYWGDKDQTFAGAKKESNIHCFKINDLKN